MCFVRNQVDFCVLRFVLGIAEAGFFPGMILYLTYWFPPKYHGAAVARFMAAIPLAGLLGSGVAAFSLGLKHGGLAGWMWLFIVTGLPAIFLGIVVRFCLPDRPRNATWLTEDEIVAVEHMVEVRTPEAAARTNEGELGDPGSNESSRADSGAPGKSETKSGASTSFLDTLQDWYVWRFALLYFSLTVSMYGFQLWLPQIIKAFGDLDDTGTALISAVPALFQALGMLIIAGHSDKTGERRYHIVLATACTFVGLGISCFGDQVWLKLAGLCLAAFGIWGSVGPFWALTTNTLKRSSHATGIAVINSVGNLGGFFGPSIIGIVKHYSHGFNDSLIALAVASVLAGIIATTSPKVSPDKPPV
jgi:ACS family tartrate transporter-like MFS transporter